MKDSVLILDFGSQYTQLIARRVREAGVYSEIRPCTTPFSPDLLRETGALILSGGPASVTGPDAPAFDPRWLSWGGPTLGVCYGMQLMGHALGGRLGKGERREYGSAEITITDTEGLFAGFSVGEKLNVWQSHGDHVDEAPAGFSVLASSTSVPLSAIAHHEKKLYGVQFHPEVVHSRGGKQIIQNFLFRIARLKNTWTPSSFIESELAKLKQQIPATSRVLCALSGGVDSTVAAVLVHRAIGDRLTCVFVDNGLLRKDEAREVERVLKEKLNLPLVCVDASEQFLSQLAGVSDPEQKRKKIGNLFIEVFDAKAKTIGGVTHLVQGTLYPDVIESVSVRGPSATIKTHHNVGGLPERMKLALVEPLRELFKDEVRRIGRELGVPDSLLNRQPFPGPGLAIRVLGAVTHENLRIVRDADAIVREEIAAAGLHDSIWQAFAVLLPVQSVGVMGDSRTYEQTIAVRAVTSEDGMTAAVAELPHALLGRISRRITNEVRGVNRVVYDISSKPPATIEWE